MFCTEDYASWVDTFYSEALDNSYTAIPSNHFSDRVWAEARISEDEPHIGNICVAIMFGDIKDDLVERYGVERDDFSWNINAQDCQFCYADEEFSSHADLVAKVEEVISHDD